MEELFFTAAIPAIFALGLFILERVFHLRSPQCALFPRLLINAGVTTLALITAMLIVRPAANAALEWSSEWGLLGLLELPWLLEAIIGFLLLDLTFYYWHRANHVVPLLWRFHNTHHIDPDLDVSTSFRFHFVEVAFSAAFRAAQVLLIGVSPWIYATYEVVFICGTLFHHSNIRLPINIERGLNWFLVTPRMHGIHHSQVQEENRSNFSVVFPWWDKVHGTLRLNIPQSEITIGIPAYPAQDNRLARLHLIPFLKQRDYWKGPDGKRVRRGSIGSSAPSTHLAP